MTTVRDRGSVESVSAQIRDMMTSPGDRATEETPIRHTNVDRLAAKIAEAQSAGERIPVGLFHGVRTTIPSDRRYPAENRTLRMALGLFPRLGVEADITVWGADTHGRFNQVDEDTIAQYLGRVGELTRKLGASFVLLSEAYPAESVDEHGRPITFDNPPELTETQLAILAKSRGRIEGRGNENQYAAVRSYLDVPLVNEAIGDGVLLIIGDPDTDFVFRQGVESLRADTVWIGALAGSGVGLQLTAPWGREVNALNKGE